MGCEACPGGTYRDADGMFTSRSCTDCPANAWTITNVSWLADLDRRSKAETRACCRVFRGPILQVLGVQSAHISNPFLRPSLESTRLAIEHITDSPE